MKFDVFISYARKDIGEVSAILDILRKRIPGLSCWFDMNGIESGDEFEDKIITAINSSVSLLAFLSDNSYASAWTRKEVVYAYNTRKKVVPVLLAGAVLKDWFLFRFGNIDCIDSCNAMQMDKLVRNLSEWSGKPILSEPGQMAGFTAAPSMTSAAVDISPETERPCRVRVDRLGMAKLAAIKYVSDFSKEHTDNPMTLAETKKLVDSVPFTITAKDRASAERFVSDLDDLGCDARIL